MSEHADTFDQAGGTGRLDRSHLTAIWLEGPNDECFDEKEILKLTTEHQARKFATEREQNLKKKQAMRVQYGALSYRLKDDASVEVLLVTSRQTKRWIIPKGWPIKGLKPAKAAAREAYEEAGVQGLVTERPIGYYVYEKRLDDLDAYVPCKVKVFALAVNRQSEKWPESKERMTCWFPAAEAAQLVGDKDLCGLILQLEEDLGGQSRPSARGGNAKRGVRCKGKPGKRPPARQPNNGQTTT